MRGALRRRVGGARLPAAIALLVIVALPQAVDAQASGESFLDEFERHFEGSALKFVALAEAMPAELYDWSPGEGVMNVARVYAHVARYNYMYLHQNMDRDSPVPMAEYSRWEQDVTEKDELVRILRESMDYVRAQIRETSPAQVGDGTRLYGRDVEEGAVLFQLIAHMNEHLGQSIAYARMNGVVPPWSS